MKKKVYLIGAGGHCRSVVDLIEDSTEYQIAGLFDTCENVGKKIFDYTIVGDDQSLEKYAHRENYFLITIGQIQTAEHRQRIFESGEKLGLQWLTLVSDGAYVSRRATLGVGTVVHRGAIVNAGAQVGKNCILNTKSLIEHDVVVGDHCHVATGAILNGGVQLGSFSFIGSHATLKQGLVLPEKTFVQAGEFRKK